MRGWGEKLCSRRMVGAGLVSAGVLIAGAAALCIVGPSPGFAQYGSQQPSGPALPPRPGADDAEGTPFPSEMQAKAQKLRNAERQRQLVADANKIVALAKELENDVDKGTPVNVARRAEEIERLARSVRDKMRAE